MKITFDRDQLRDLFTELVLITDNINLKNSPTYGYVRVDVVDEGVSFTAFNPEVHFFRKLKANFGSERSSEKFTLPVRAVLSLLKTLPEGDVTISTTIGNVIEISQEKRKFTFIGISPTLIPIVDIMPKEGTPLNPQELSKVISTVSYAASKNASRGALRGILFEPANDGFTRAVCSNGMVLITHLFRAHLNKQVVLLAESASVLKKILEKREDDISIYVDETTDYLWIKGVNLLLKFRVINQNFPNYKKALPTDILHTITISRSETIDALSRICLFGKDKESLSANIAFGEQDITYTLSNKKNTATEIVPNKEPAEALQFSELINPYYMLLNLLHLKGEVITVDIFGTLKPIIVKAESTLTLIMPKRGKE